MNKFPCFALISDGFATEGCFKQCEDCKIRYPEPKEKLYVNYHKSENDWRMGIFTEKEFENEQEAIDFWYLVTNNHLGTTKLTREKRYKINHLSGDFR